MTEFDWEAVVARAREGYPMDLVITLNRFSAWFQANHRRPLAHNDVPAVVVEYWREQAAPTGKRGRPKTSDWDKAAYRDLYEWELHFVSLAKEFGGAILDDRGNKYPIDDRPSTFALEKVAEAMSEQRGREIGIEAARDVVFPERKQKRRIKHNEKRT